MSEQERLRRSWVANASSWCDAVRKQQIESRRVVTDAAIVEAVLEAHPRSVLDLGCGEGWLARALASHGIEVTGVDASAPLIEAANALGGARFLALGYEELGALAGSSFDAVAANFSLLEEDVHAVLVALSALLAPDGRLIVQTVHPAFAGGAYVDGWRTETFAAFEGEWPEAMPWYFRTLESWSGALAAAGYTIARMREPLHPERGVPASVIFEARR
ncbi:MAG TPA: class I SAM-dependent methyltransferase [Thermoanaerobaculia bacterium]